MFISPKKYIRRDDGKVVEARKGVSGTLVVAEGGELSEKEALELGLYDIIPEPLESQLREDGPTFEQWTGAGYPADKYPPHGYEERPSPGYAVYLQNKKRQEAGLRPTNQTPTMTETGEADWQKDARAAEAEKSSPAPLPLGSTSEAAEEAGKAFPQTIGSAPPTQPEEK